MLVTLHSRIADLDGLIQGAERIQDAEIKRFTPWIFQHVQVVDWNYTESWPDERSDFKDFFWLLNSYYAELTDPDENSLTSALKVSETIKLPRKNWKVTEREHHDLFMKSQDTIQQVPRLYFPVSKFEQRYVIGGQRYASRPDGAVVVGPQERRLPIISFVGWYEGQTWGDFIAEILSIMLGQLAKNTSVKLQDQEVFVVGIFWARCLYLPSIFQKGLDFAVKEDWFEAMIALTGLLRYLLSGNSKVSAVEAYLNGAEKS
ncbi:uncharacterized protein KD926_007716 [Aspergillus affinis]|uniref:uncharacterized protein n=1 Tax=Aspergillus affinis TaxID=1070780 RepID=UPI0022FF1745|nr:uncharacterized protein KD926_007716 [Aspergillus affinis]KAI9040773.1 hypothetical protein KD926_007716 [Aspergillus affinis]